MNSPILPFILPYKLKNEIIKFVTDDHDKWFNHISNHNSSGKGKRNLNIEKKPTTFSNDVIDFCDSCFYDLGIDPKVSDPKFGTCISTQYHGNSVILHKDPVYSIDGKESATIRILFLLNKPASGGMPIINGTQFEIEETQSWINFATLWEHESTPVVGNSPRIVLNAGRLITHNAAIKLEERFRNQSMDFQQQMS